MFRRLLLTATLVAVPCSSIAVPPAWWLSRNATNGSPVNDDSVANQGQLKHFTQKAAEELNARVPGSAGEDLDNLVQQWSAGHPDPDDFHAITAGQLKWIAAKICGRLIYLRYLDNLPTWLPAVPPVPPDPADKELVNLGQLKTVFDFDLSAPSGGIPEWWQKFYFGEKGIDPEGDYDGDGLSNADEFSAGTNPMDPDSDGDGVPDGYDPHPLAAEVEGAGTSSLVVWTRLEH